jgi:hypothetical protein
VIMSSAMRKALQKILREGKFPGLSVPLDPEDEWSPSADELTRSDRRFLEIWLNDCADDPAWDRIVTAARRFNSAANYMHLWLLRDALQVRRRAHEVSSGVDPRLQQRVSRRDYLLELKEHAESIARYWDRAQMKLARLLLSPPPFPVSFPRVMEFQDLNREQAGIFRQLAGSTPSPTVRVTRQRKSRERTSFMRPMVNLMKETCGKPRYNDVAMLTNIAFPDIDTSKDQVRLAATQATTRSGRRRKTDAPKRKKRTRVHR